MLRIVDPSMTMAQARAQGIVTKAAVKRYGEDASVLDKPLTVLNGVGEKFAAEIAFRAKAAGAAAPQNVGDFFQHDVLSCVATPHDPRAESHDQIGLEASGYRPYLGNFEKLHGDSKLLTTGRRSNQLFNARNFSNAISKLAAGMEQAMIGVPSAYGPKASPVPTAMGAALGAALEGVDTKNPESPREEVARGETEPKSFVAPFLDPSAYWPKASPVPTAMGAALGAALEGVDTKNPEPRREEVARGETEPKSFVGQFFGLWATLNKMVLAPYLR